MRNIKFILVLVLAMALLLGGCALLNPIPEEYTEGVKVPRDYPDKELEIYDDAVVFEADEDDEEITLSYGTEDEIDDVIDFYEDLFEDEDELRLEESEDDKDEYYAKGYGDGYVFEIEAGEAKGEYEEKVFATVVEVMVEFIDAEEMLQNNIQGFWHVCGVAGEVSDETKLLGAALEFDGNIVKTYEYFELINETNFEVVDEDTIKYTMDDEEYIVDIKFEKVDGEDGISMLNDGVTINFVKSSLSEMKEYMGSTTTGGDSSSVDLSGVIYLSDNLGDGDLEMLIQDTNWYYTYYLNLDGDYEPNDDGYYNRMLFSSDGTGEDEYVEGTDQLSDWYVMGGVLYMTYTDGTDDYYDIDYEFDGINGYLYLYFTEGDAWVYSQIEMDLEDHTIEDELIPMDMDLTDADLEYLISDCNWYVVSYAYADGSTYMYTADDGMWRLYFDSSDYTAEEELDSGINDITWYVQDGSVYFTYSDGMTYQMPVDYEYDGTGYYMYLYDMTDGSEGNYYIFVPYTN